MPEQVKDVCAVVLCGGQSTRMGTNKSLLRINDVKVIDRVTEELKEVTDNVIVIANEHKPYKYLNLPLYRDRYRDAGPLAGIESAMHHVQADAYLFAACDMPFANQAVYRFLLDQLEDYHAVVPKYKGRVHPLSSIYKRDCLPIIQKKLDEADLRVRSFYEDIDINFVDSFSQVSESDLEKHFFNMNNPEQYERAKILANKN